MIKTETQPPLIPTGEKMFNFLTNHIKYDRPDKPQTYFEHGWFAFKHCVWLIWAALFGIIHSIFPWWFKFYTADQVIRIYVNLEKSGRHKAAIAKYRPRGFREEDY